MKRIVIDARELRTTTGRYIERLLHYLQQIDTGHEYIVLLYPRDFDSWQPTNPNFTKLKSPYKEFTFGEQLGFALQLYGLRADLVHFGMTQQPLLYLKRSVTTVHDLTVIRFRNPLKNPLVFWVKQQVYKAVIWFAAHKSRQVIVPTQFVKKDLTQFTRVNPDKVVVTLESADKITDPAEPVAAVGDKQFIMYVGRAQPHKNLWRLIEAFRSLHEQHPELYLVLVGKIVGNYTATIERIKTEQIANIICTDFVSDGQLRWLYEHTSAYMFPSLSEGFGLPGLEAMHYGAPVLSSNATCLPEVYGDAALYFNPLDATDIAAKINTILTDKQVSADLRAQSAAHLKNFSWQRMAQQTVEVYRRTLGE